MTQKARSRGSSSRGALAGRVTAATLRRELLPRLRSTAEWIERDLVVARP